MFLKKFSIYLLAVFILSGCATYKFKKSGPAAAQGYVVTYDDDSIIEYTVGKDKTLPDLELAKERFKRRRVKVEYYYKKMGLIQSRLKEVFWEPPAMFVDFLGGILRWPFIAVADYRYNHNPKYKERVDRLDEQREALEKARINKLKEKLDIYVAEDLAKETLPQSTVVTVPLQPAPVSQVIAPASTTIPEPTVETKPVEIVPVIKPALEPPVAVITAKPMKGYSPLKVKFSGQKSYSKSSKIVAYLWDFGDGDTSTKKNPENTYWSTTYGIRQFTVTLTVRDETGATSSVTSIIEVSTP